jgi:3-hydroxybutyryl-CoA dehydrogenase
MENVSVIGAGLMGSQIAMCAALAGFKVFLHDVDEDQLSNGQNQLFIQIEKYIAKGMLTLEQVEKAKQNLILETSLSEAVGQAELVIEAVVEDLTLKRELFQQLDKLTPPETILATNSSMIGSSMLASYTNRPDKVCNIHFFNPVFIMSVVEVVKGAHTSDETAKTAVDFVKRMNKTPLLLKKEITGFIANRILGKIMEEAMFLLEAGIATVEEIDLACTKALNHPIGPFALMDLTGLDTAYAIQKTQFELEEDAKQPSSLLKQKLDYGQLGRKTGQGFYTYQ